MSDVQSFAGLLQHNAWVAFQCVFALFVMLVALRLVFRYVRRLARDSGPAFYWDDDVDGPAGSVWAGLDDGYDADWAAWELELRRGVDRELDGY